MRKLRWLALLPLSLLWPDDDGAAAETRNRALPRAMEAKYEISWLGLPVYEGRFTGTVGEHGYRASFSSKSVGVMALLANSTITASTAGMLGGDAFRLARFDANAVWRKKKRAVIMTVDKTGDVHTTLEPAERIDKRPAVPAVVRRQAVDPITGLLNAITLPLDNESCRLTVPIFDGRRRLDVRLEMDGREELRAPPRPDLLRTLLRCRVYVEAVAGFNDKELKDMPKAGEYGKLWLARMPGAQLWIPLRMEYASQWGPIAGELIDYKVRLGAAN
ncbi:MAG: DUF3108 domain-containing protein [Alphaproteobacteria bacterium]